MPFQYLAYTPQGEQVRGRIDTSSEKTAEESLWKLNYTIISLREVQEAAGGIFSLGGKVRSRDLIVFSRQMATLIESGIPIVRSLQLLRDQTAHKVFRRVLSEIITDIQQGRFFSEAILKHKKAFPAIYGRLVEVGERAGNLEMVLRQLAIYIEKEEALVRKIRGAMAYPSFVMGLAVVVIAVMMTVALPPLMDLFVSFNAELPLPTRVLIALTKFTSQWKFHLLGGLVGIVVVVVLFLRTQAGHIALDGIILKIPIVGRVTIQGAVARVCRSMSTLLQAGLALPEILELSIRTQGNRIISSALHDVRNGLLQGHGLADPLARHKLFPGMLVQMVRVGEETGSLDTNMATLAVFYEDEVDRAVSALSAAVEPALTIFIGVVVGFVAIAVIMPMYSLMGSIQ